ncbi:MAG: heme ABC exporter ATP-binding protein CcmA [Brevefilum sp.]|nr:heme ABC exporter ATP-binding protein CcmA [Brevefilum sp.]
MSTQTSTLLSQIEMRDLVKRFHHQPVLNHLSLRINDGDLCVLVGDNGAGKTTLLRILAGLVRPNHGIVTIGGADPISDPQVRRFIGYVGHQPMFYQDLTALENLVHYARLYQVEAVQHTVIQAIQSVGLTPYQDQPVRTLSRGMQQRLSLARAALHQPSILLLDEPYTGLDQDAAAFLDDTLQGLHTPGRTILLAAHRPQRLLTIASHVAWLKDGVIHRHLPVDRLGEDPELGRYLQEVG